MNYQQQAIASVEAQDAGARRIAVGRVLAILMHLQSRLRPDVGGNSAKALSEYYAAVFALCLEGSRLESTERFKEAIGCIRDVREAWSVAAHDPEVLRLLGEGVGEAARMVLTTAARPPVEGASSSWTA